MLTKKFAITSENTPVIVGARAVLKVNADDKVVALHLSYLDENDHRVSFLTDPDPQKVIDVMTSHKFVGVNYNDTELENFIDKSVSRFFKRQSVHSGKNRDQIAAWLLLSAKEQLEPKPDNVTPLH